MTTTHPSNPSLVLPFAEEEYNPSVAKKQGRSRSMSRTELAGRHEHMTQHGQRIQIWTRDGKYLARARWEGCQIGVTLGPECTDAEHALRRLLTEMENGAFVPGSQARHQRFPPKPVPRLDLRGLVNCFLADRRSLKGKQTAHTYGNRLMHALEFAELPKSRKRWPLAASINREFAVEFRAFLFDREVTRNGKDGALPKRMSVKMIRLCLEALRAALRWGAKGDVRKLPAGFVHPFTTEIIGAKPRKDPLRPNPIPMANRIRIVEQMDAWQLCQLSPLFVLPLRFEDLAGAVISEFDLDHRSWSLGTRLGGDDFNKGRFSLQMPLPPELCGVLGATSGGRPEGPMFRSRADAEKSRRRRWSFSTPAEFAALCERAIHDAPRENSLTEQDRKAVIRKLLRKCGAVSTDAIGDELRQLFRAAGISHETRPYDLRAAVTTDMHDAGLRHLELRYLTEHSINDILNEYASLDPVGEMQKYFRHIAPLLDAIQQQAKVLGIPDSLASDLANRNGRA